MVLTKTAWTKRWQHPKLVHSIPRGGNLSSKVKPVTGYWCWLLQAICRLLLCVCVSAVQAQKGQRVTVICPLYLIVNVSTKGHHKKHVIILAHIRISLYQDHFCHPHFSMPPCVSLLHLSLSSVIWEPGDEASAGSSLILCKAQSSGSLTIYRKS